MKRPAPWQARRIAEQKALRQRAPCDTPGCKNLGMGWYGIYTPRSLWLCVYCATKSEEERDMGTGPLRRIASRRSAQDTAGRVHTLVTLECGHEQIGEQPGKVRRCVQCEDEAKYGPPAAAPRET